MTTRSSVRKEIEKKEAGLQQDGLPQQPQPGTSMPTDGLKTSKKAETAPDLSRTMVLVGSSIKSERRAPPPPPASTLGSKSKRCTSSSLLARKKKLELEAAKKKAQIQLELIDKALEADIAELEEEYSPQSEELNDVTGEVEKWLEQSHQELQGEQLAHDHGNSPGQLRAPPPPTDAVGNDTGTVQILATALRDLAAASANTRPNANLLSRISTPRDLPSFSGDPMEWLQFKQAFEESSEVCGFTSKENLWRLRKCLSGAAKEAVSALLVTATSPDKLMSTLELRFGNPDNILARIVQDIRKLQPMSPEYHRDIVYYSVKVQNFVAAVRSVGRNEYLQGMNIAAMILSKLPTVLISKWSDYSYPLITVGQKSRMEILSDFLSEEAVKISTTANVSILGTRSDGNKQRQPVQLDQSASRSYAMLVQSNESDKKCLYCRISQHSIVQCKAFKKALRKDRWRYVKRYGMCYKCLVARHDRETCPAAPCDKDGCGAQHHRLLHYPPRDEGRPSSGVDMEVTAQVNETVSHIRSGKCQVLLKTVPVTIHGPTGKVNTVALLDDGSTVTLISSALASRVGIRGDKQTMRVCGAWNNNELVCDSYVMDLNLSNNHGEMFTLKARAVDDLNLPVQDLCLENLDNFGLENLRCELTFDSKIKPELLIGQDNYDLIVPLEIVSGKPNEPYATRTPLGWCVHGRVHASATDDRVHTALFLSESNNSSEAERDRILHEIDENVRRSFTIESMGVSGKPRQNADDVRAWEQLDQSSTLIDGNWTVGLPWRDPGCKMPNSYPVAASRLRGIEKKMKSSEGFAHRYSERIDHLFENNFAEELANITVTDRTWFLPHFGVDNPNKKKLRLVFDAAAKTNGLSLNDYLLKGPDLLMSLFGIMMRFREKSIGISGDIKDMFLRVKILPEDRNAFRFLWRPTSKSSEQQVDDCTISGGVENPVKTYVMTSLIFGANCSPFVAQFVKNKNARRFEDTMPLAVEAICRDHYMDDYIQSIEDEDTATKLIQEVINIHKQGGFEIRNFTSNSQEVLHSLPKESLGPTAVKFKSGQQDDGERTLGLIWFPIEDTLGFDVSFKRIPECIITGEKRPTKRDMLRLIMSIFDVYGFLSPFTIRGKIMLQDTWRANIDWDETITDAIYKQWIEWINLLARVNNIRLPRYYCSGMKSRSSDGDSLPQATQSAPALDSCYQPPPPSSPPHHFSVATRTATRYTNLQLHTFCDSSTKAMCAVSYWRWIDGKDNTIRTAFIASKCRVAPVKLVSVPRLELQSSLLAARLAETIINEHTMTPVRRFFWSDSSTVLHWIKNNARNYKAYVAHRLGEIDELSQANEWRYVPTNLNVSDIATRDDCDITVFEGEWFRGPAFLFSDEDLWPADIAMPKVNTENLECVALIKEYPEDLPAVPDSTRFSSWLRLLRSTCNVLSFVDKLKKLTGEIDGEMMRRAESLLLQYSQAQSFPEDLTNLKQKNTINSTSRLLTLSPILDEHGVMRADGRIRAAPGIESDAKQPVILDGKNNIARLIVQHYHARAAHGNQETVVNDLKQKYWIIRIRPTVKNVTSKCMLCRIRKAKPQPPRMGDLPKARMAHHKRPFTHCGLDLFGPMEVTVGRRREKRYGVIFTCLTVRAIHLEIVHSLTTDSLIMALRRMASRRGWPSHLYSDNGTNLRGADAELKKSVLELDEEALKGEAVNYGTTWTFIPPASPHWGGAWERLIRSVKSSLKVILKERAPRDETFHTLIAEVEHIVNSRPLTHVSVEPSTQEALTPNHFLLGSSSNLPILGAYNDTELRKQWRIAQRLADMYWRRWVREILPDMIPRSKWHLDKQPLQVGDLVLIVDPESPRNVWPRGLIVTTMPGKDGRVRVVDVRTKSGVLRRSAARVAKIPIGDEC